ncbi:hypothetical protein K502DRAFT_362129 [Neoconidiobolus thromboides FSU 785]|nr:hypothetical protein K502DRAFT_362129 [Neoconidiobolus thromboides FSU 785]
MTYFNSDPSDNFNSKNSFYFNNDNMNNNYNNNVNSNFNNFNNMSNNHFNTTINNKYSNDFNNPTQSYYFSNNNLWNSNSLSNNTNTMNTFSSLATVTPSLLSPPIFRKRSHDALMDIELDLKKLKLNDGPISVNQRTENNNLMNKNGEDFHPLSGIKKVEILDPEYFKLATKIPEVVLKDKSKERDYNALQIIRYEPNYIKEFLLRFLYPELYYDIDSDNMYDEPIVEEIDDGYMAEEIEDDSIGFEEVCYNNEANFNSFNNANYNLNNSYNNMSYNEYNNYNSVNYNEYNNCANINYNNYNGINYNNYNNHDATYQAHDDHMMED